MTLHEVDGSFWLLYLVRPWSCILSFFLLDFYQFEKNPSANLTLRNDINFLMNLTADQADLRFQISNSK